MEKLNETYLKQYYDSLPHNEKIVLFSKSNYANTGLTKEQLLKNKYYMIESVSSYERRRISSYKISRTKSCSDITDIECYTYKDIWKVNDAMLSNWFMKLQEKGFRGPSLYYWPTYTKHIDEKNKESARMFISSLIRPKHLTPQLVKSLMHTV